MRAPLLWAIPGMTLCFIFHYLAVAAGATYAFTDWDGLTRPNFTGVDNFIKFVSTPTSRVALINTLLLAAAYVVGTNAIGMLLAVGLHKTLKARMFLRSMFFAPVVMSPLAVSYIWQFLLDARGPINAGLSAIGLESLKRVWLGDPQFALWSICLVMVWQMSGLCMALYLAGLQNISAEIDEAAEIDGTTAWVKFHAITLPLLAPAATISVTITTIAGLRVFDQVMALTRGGPGYASETLATELFKQTFVNGHFGYGAAISLVLTAIMLVVSGAQIVVLRRRERNL
jgi:raffinose/stachyose/melibiose transport system permease protein